MNLGLYGHSYGLCHRLEGEELGQVLRKADVIRTRVKFIKGAFLCRSDRDIGLDKDAVGLFINKAADAGFVRVGQGLLYKAREV